MKYNKVAKALLAILIICAALVVFFCFISFSESFRYRSAFTENSDIETIFPLNNTTIIIDAGHGGEDPGAVANGLMEKELNLKVSHHLRDFLSLSGYDVVMTREDDVLLGSGTDISSHKNADLRTRLSFIERYNDCIFVSIHMNKFESSSAKGLQTFYSDNCADSAILAEKIQNASLAVDSSNKRSIKPDDNNIFILEHAFKPAVLVECGFISNSSDAANLSLESYQKKLAFCIYKGITEYLGD